MNSLFGELFRDSWPAFGELFGQNFGQVVWGQKILCTVLRGQTNRNYLLFTIQIPTHTKLYVWYFKIIFNYLWLVHSSSRVYTVLLIGPYVFSPCSAWPDFWPDFWRYVWHDFWPWFLAMFCRTENSVLQFYLGGEIQSTVSLGRRNTVLHPYGGGEKPGEKNLY